MPEDAWSADARGLRRLSVPKPVTVTARDRVPVAVVVAGRRVAVAAIDDRWRIDEGWWLGPLGRIARTYYRVVLATGSVRTLYHDVVRDEWCAQPYG